MFVKGWILFAFVTLSLWAGDTPLQYPKTTEGDHVDLYHGTKVADPYRWLEDLDSSETKHWVDSQNKVTFGYLSTLPQRDSYKKRLTEVWNYERYSAPFKRGGRYFYFKNDGLQNQSVLYVQDNLKAKAKLLLDPNTLSADGTAALSGSAVSRDGKWLAYGISRAGSDWQEWFVRDIETGKDRADHIRWVKFSGASWDGDGKGFFYSRYDEPEPGQEMEDANYNHKLYYHTLGTTQAHDRLVYQRPDHKDWGFSGQVTDDGNYLIITVWKGTERRNRVFYQDLGKGDSHVTELLNDFDASYEFLDNSNQTFWFKTDRNAAKGSVIAIDLNQPKPANWRVVIPEAQETLNRVSVISNRFVASYFKHALSTVKIFKEDGSYEKTLAFPGPGTARGFDGQRSDHETFYTFNSYITPPSIYRYNVKTGKSTLFRQAKVPADLDGFVSKQVFFTSKDGTRVPMMISHKKGLPLNGENPTLLYGYGGFNISLTPNFNTGNLVWMERGGVLAVPNLRGGGEYGRDWHMAGTKDRKQNVFDDFIAAAEWLIEKRITSSAHLGIFGGSNGGLLVGACMTQRPDLFAVAMPAVGVLDMLRFHKFTIGWAWVSDYGSADNTEDFDYLFAYSPLHNLKEGTNYPATLITTGDHDDRVVPSHSFKFAARLQKAHKGNNPVLIRIETDAGHGAGKPTSKIIAEAADRWAFLDAHTRKKSLKEF